MKFRSRSDLSGYDREYREYPKVEPVFGYVVDKVTGEKSIGMVGETNVYEKKQQQVKDVLLSTLIERYNRTGDASVFGEAVEGFVDVTGMPRTLMEAENIRIEAENLFNSLPVEERRKYDHNLSKFLFDVNNQIKDRQRAAIVNGVRETGEVPTKEVDESGSK